VAREPLERPLRPFTAAAQPVADADGFTFAVVGDTQPPLPRMPHSAVTRQVMRELALLRPAFVLHTGDSIWGYQDSRQEMLNEIDRFRALGDATGVPFYRVAGNHELQSEPAALEVLRERGFELYGSFDVGGYHFVALNTDGVNEEGRIPDEQLEWLDRDLERSAEAEGVFVFMHRPPYSWFQGDFNEDDRDALQRLFRRRPVKAVFAGHDHFYYEETHDGVRYLTVGGGGGTLYTQPPAGGFSHYLLVRVDPEGIHYDVVEPGHLELAYVRGNDGLEPVATARVMNTTERHLVARNLEFRLPRLSSADGYRVTTECFDYKRRAVELPASVGDVVDTDDGSATVSVEVPLPAGMCFWVSVEAREE
jgi:3',5'-cyclic AMP phosphodiesterase CpdA